MPTTYAIPNGRTAFSAITYTGNGASNSNTTQNITTPFYPDIAWVKGRNTAFYHRLTSTGLTQPNYLSTNSTDAEDSVNDQISALASTYFQVKASGTGGTNQSGATYVGWAWNANNGTTASNTAGSITSTVSVNTAAGISIVNYTGNGTSGATVGHGLGVAPSLILPKVRSRSGDNWHSYHVALGGTQGILLNSTNAASTDSGFWNNTNPSSSVITLGTYNTFSGQTYVAYCFSEVAGYSKFGSYTGNGSADGPFIYTGFRPKWIMIKRSTGVDNWIMIDSSRNTYNLATNTLYANSSSAEETLYNGADLLSNGFKLRTTNTGTNQSGETYIYATFAENPFKYANAG